MTAIHTTWAALPNSADVASKIIPSSAHKETFSWGHMWLWESTDSPSIGPEQWIVGRVNCPHRIAVYEVICGARRDTAGKAFGVASIFPEETLSVLHYELLKICAPEEEPEPISTTLEPDAIDRCVKARVASVKYREDLGFRLEKYSNPIELTELPRTDSISAMSLYLCENLGSPNPSLISLFTGSQFYITNCTPDSIGQVAHQICPLWGFTEE
ncbi:hypothetical protein OG594_09180 [Streptomyces sp. NBC_01214]|uniref:hypothetical protein n=1 Tax=Streptomyces sp. NBC_01214 TaxID=2903777 RepID=UPI00225B6130|nr:hypothetical protein [Streptomyces sp. NBC_01214]MCX4801823.1 hypothetical protein [Streptomyces sp. NBC_01214]